MLFGAGFLYMLFTIIKDMLGGKTFDELHADIMILAFIGIIEWGMITVGFSKDKNKEDEEDEAPEAALEGENERDGAEEFTEGLSEEFEGYGSDPDDAPGGSDADAADGSAVCQFFPVSYLSITWTFRCS